MGTEAVAETLMSKYGIWVYKWGKRDLLLVPCADQGSMLSPSEQLVLTFLVAVYQKECRKVIQVASWDCYTGPNSPSLLF